MANQIDVAVGQRIRFRRLLLGMSQTALADSVGITFQQIQKYEKGINRVGGSRLYAIAQVLTVPVSFFFEELPATGKGNLSETIHGLLNRDGVELHKSFNSIKSPTARKAVVDLAKALAE